MNAAAPFAFRSVSQALRKTTELLAREVAAPSSQAPQWNEFEWRIATAAAAMQGISVLLRHRLLWTGSDFWESFLREQERQALLREARLHRLRESIDAGAKTLSVSAVHLKGSALGRLGVYRPGERVMGDIDLLVREPDAEALGAALAGVGYVPTVVMKRHISFQPDGGSTLVGYAEHVDNTIKVELHTKVAEPLPITEVNITDAIYPARVHAGLNDYASIAALMAHLLLHAAGNIRARALRQIQLHDIAVLAQRMRDGDWRELAALVKPEGLWWALPPLLMTNLYYAGSIPTVVLNDCSRECTRWLLRASERQQLTDISWSNLRIQAFPGIEWSGSLSEAVIFMWSRIAPRRSRLNELRHMAATQPWAAQIPWYGQSHVKRILRWLFTNPPRVQTLYSVRAALSDA